MQLAKLADLFDGRVLRERILILGAALSLLLASWDVLLMQPLRSTSVALKAELQAAGIDPNDAALTSDDPHHAAVLRATELQQQTTALDSRIAGTANGFVPASKMIDVLQNVLERQSRLKLVSIRNLPMRSLVDAPDAAIPQTPPYLHSIEVIVDGRYVDIQDYVRQLEALPWKFRWSELELSTLKYPVNRVRLHLSTLSMDATWLGV
jgi:MSHA biogenesis protein MshJ